MNNTVIPMDNLKKKVSSFIDLMAEACQAGQGGSVLEITNDDGRIGVNFKYVSTGGSMPFIIDPPLSKTGVVGIALVTSGGNPRWQRIDINGDPAGAFDKSYFDCHPVFGQVRDVEIDGQHMVSVPRFYVRREQLKSGPYAGSQAWFISDGERHGFTVHSAFHSGQDQAGGFYVGKYQASMQGKSLASVPSVMPVVDLTLTKCEQFAQARNEGNPIGWMQWSARQLAAIQWLYLLENASLDSLKTTGPGRTDENGKASVDSPDVVQASYRGITGLWGNVWQWLGGLKIVDGIIHVESKHTPGVWVNTGHKPPFDQYYPVEFAEGDEIGDLFIASNSVDHQTNAATPSAQYFREGKGEFFSLVGGDWTHASAAGLLCLYVYGPASNSDTSIGARLAKRFVS